MYTSAVLVCMESGIKVHVFALNGENAIVNAVFSESKGTVIGG